MIRPISAREYHGMGELGIIGSQERVELLEGELIAMPPIGPDHAFSVRELTELFVQTFAGRAIVDVQNPVALDAYSEPEPDVNLAPAYGYERPFTRGEAPAPAAFPSDSITVDALLP